MKKVLSMFVFVGFCAGLFAAGTALDTWLKSRTGDPAYTVTNSDEVVSVTMSLRPYQVDEANATTTYVRYQSGAGAVLILRYSVSGNITTCEKSYAAWANRATATYSAVNN